VVMVSAPSLGLQLPQSGGYQPSLLTSLPNSPSPQKSGC
jgi:hypothetical protein